MQQRLAQLKKHHQQAAAPNLDIGSRPHVIAGEVDNQWAQRLAVLIHDDTRKDAARRIRRTVNLRDRKSKRVARAIAVLYLAA